MADEFKLDTYYNFVKDNVVYIHDEFDWGISKHVLHDFKKLIDEKSPLTEGRITIDVCSNGGYVAMLSELLALVELAKEKDIIIETRAMSMAHSCGSILLASGTKGHRSASPLTKVLVHHPTSYNISATGEQLEREYARTKFLNATFKQLLERYTTIPKKKMDEMLEDDSYYVYGDDLIKFGIVDKFEYQL